MPLDHEPAMTWLLFTLAMILAAAHWLYVATVGHYAPEWVAWTGYCLCTIAGAWGGYRAGNALGGPK